MTHEASELICQQAYVGGKWIESSDSRVFEVLNPYNDDVLAEVPDLASENIEEAIQSASAGFELWRRYSAQERSDHLMNWHQVILENQDALATILTLEQGKPLAEAIGEIVYGASFIRWFAEEGRRSYGDTIPGPSRDKRLLTIREPVGVVGAITPWNFPNAMLTRKIAPALAAGCSVILKPSELTPLSALALAKLADIAEIPPGVLNIITTADPAPIGKILCEHPDVKKISFTGSTRVGRLLMSQSSGRVKRLSLELGGNAPFIVMNDADLNEAVAGAIQAKFRNGGQTCVSANRFYIHRDIQDQFVEMLFNEMNKLTCGNGLDPSTDIGPLIHTEACRKVDHAVRDAIEKGAVRFECSSLDEAMLDSGKFYPPLMLTRVSEDMDICHTEIFGPVVPIQTFESDEEVICASNRTPYGLAAYLYGNDLKRIWHLSESLKFGMVGVNTGMISTTVAPFGGVKESGFGREGSKYGLDDYTQLKYICLGGMK
jgi:succinate-semialdehyde dehydrogenase/glutarate-semialdehyde dehydrogenase